MSVRTFTQNVVHKGKLMRSSATGLAFRQPENIVDFSSASADGLRFSVTVADVVGSADSWKLAASFQLCKWGGGTGAPNTAWAWYDVEPAQKSFMLPEGGFDKPEFEVTNLSSNSTLAVDASGWAQYPGTGGVASGAYQSGPGFHGDGFRRATWTTGTTTPSGGQGGPVVPVTAGERMTFGLAVRESRSVRGSWAVRWNDGSYTYGPQVVLPAGAWQFGGLHVTVPSGKSSGHCVFLAAGTDGVDGSSNRVIGDFQDVDAHLVALGQVPISYVDGSMSVPAEQGVLASSNDVLPVHRSRVVKGFGRFVAIRFAFKDVVNPSSDFGVVLSIATD